MKPFAVIPLLLLLAVSGCQSFSLGGQTAHADETGLRVIFIYDRTADSTATNDYFDALFEAVNNMSLERDQITIYSGKAEDLAQKYPADHYPALIIKKNGIQQYQIEGQQDKQAILDQLRPIIQKK